MQFGGFRFHRLILFLRRCSDRLSHEIGSDEKVQEQYEIGHIDGHAENRHRFGHFTWRIRLLLNEYVAGHVEADEHLSDL